MALKYGLIEVYTSEDARHQGLPLHDCIVQYVHALHIAARCVVLRGIHGCYESGEIATEHIEVISFNMPLKVEILVPVSDVPQVLAYLDSTVSDGIVAVKEIELHAHRSRGRLIPRQIQVKNVMTRPPRSATQETKVSEVISLLLHEDFDSVPVVDAKGHPIGIITEGDLITRAGMPVRVGLLDAFEKEQVDELVSSLQHKTAGEVMTHPVTMIEEDRMLLVAVEWMLEKKLKRLPVVNSGGRLVGMLSRLDVFRIVERESPDWSSAGWRNVEIGDLRLVRDIMRRDTQTVRPEAPVKDVISVIDTGDIQRVAVVDDAGKLLGMISDRDLLAFFLDRRRGVWDYLMGRVPFTASGKRYRYLAQVAGAETAADVMRPDLITVKEGSTIDEAARLMMEHRLKRLPVVGDDGSFRGLVSRDSLLRTGVAESH